MKTKVDTFIVASRVLATLMFVIAALAFSATIQHCYKHRKFKNEMREIHKGGLPSQK